MRTFARMTAAAMFAVAGLGGAAFAEEMKMGAELTGAQEVPANDSKGMGTVDATYDTDTKKLSWTVTYSGLTGDATAAHFHGPAMPGENAKPTVPLTDLKSGATGTADLTEAQAADLMAGKWYFNVHTAAHEGGEIRGQVGKAM